MNPKQNAAGPSGTAPQRFPRWDDLPDIDLYLDQVLSLMDRYLAACVPVCQGHVVTASMINNYVKLRVMPPPVKKRYGRLHLAYCIVIALLKQVLPIQEVKALLRHLFEEDPSGAAQAFDRFCALQERAFADAQRRASSARDAAAQTALAVELAAQANACKSTAQRLMAHPLDP